MTASLATTVLAYYALAIVSAVVPWVNAELVMVSAVPLAGSPLQLTGLVVAVSLGQMTGKSVMYWLSRRSAARPTWTRWQRSVDAWRARFDTRPVAALALTFVSALIGIPPFFIVSIAAGAVRVAFGWFLAVGIAGRLLHFGAVALLPGLLQRTS
jgi:membrane protein YqaA with SNARE-associated domain